jgi:hypothetical protein
MVPNSVAAKAKRTNEILHRSEEDLAGRWFQTAWLPKQKEQMKYYTDTSGKNNGSKLSYKQDCIKNFFCSTTVLFPCQTSERINTA